MPIEKRVRVEIFLPIRSDLSAYQVALDWLAEEFAFLRGGATLTTPFAGLFASSDHSNIVEDAIRILFSDFELDTDQGEDLIGVVSLLENVREFLIATLEEEEVWIIFYPISRIIS